MEFLPIPTEPEIDQDAIVESWRADADDIERAFGYRMSDRQKRTLAEHAYDTGMPLLDAAQDLAERGRGVLPDLDDESLSANQRRELRQAQMVERLRDREGVEDPVTGAARPSRPEGTGYDTARHQDRVDLA